jgi:hypothetical protein
MWTATAMLAADITAICEQGKVRFLDGKSLITEYHTAESVAKPYFWPLHAPGGEELTRAWPLAKGRTGETTDHVHQKSAWLCHGDVIPEGYELKTRSADKHVKGVDFWSEAKGHGKIAVVGVGRPTTNDDGVVVVTQNEWRSPDGDTILHEERTITVTKHDTGYLIAVESVLKAKDYAITFGDTKEGSFGIRIADDLRCQLATGGTVTSSSGASATPGTKGTLKLWGEQADWHDYSGTRGEATMGLAIFDHPKNAFRAAWHTRDYGLMAANPFGRAVSGFPSRKEQTELVRLEKGTSLTLNYALFAHTGDATTGKVQQAYKTYSSTTK